MNSCMPIYSELRHTDTTTCTGDGVYADAIRTGRLLGWSRGKQWRWVVFRLLMRWRRRARHLQTRSVPLATLPVPISAISAEPSGRWLIHVPAWLRQLSGETQTMTTPVPAMTHVSGTRTPRKIRLVAGRTSSTSRWLVTYAQLFDCRRVGTLNNSTQLKFNNQLCGQSGRIAM